MRFSVCRTNFAEQMCQSHNILNYRQVRIQYLCQVLLYRHAFQYLLKTALVQLLAQI